MALPLLLSVPHAGTRVPPELADRCLLTREEIVADGDEGAGTIYDLGPEVLALVTTDVARAVLDMNRAEGDRRKDGVVKTHTCWDVPIWRTPLDDDDVRRLIDHHWRPYHARLDAPPPGALLGVDGHTMAAAGPPVGPDPGRERPWICLGNADGTMDEASFLRLAACFEEAFGRAPALNMPFAGGYIVRAHSRRLPWVQVELSRGPFLSDVEKRRAVLAALTLYCTGCEAAS